MVTPREVTNNIKYRYLVNSILFKFAVDSYGIFNGDDAKAAKVAGNDLKGIVAYFNCNIDGLYVPITAIIDYFGFRGRTFFRVSLIPIFFLFHIMVIITLTNFPIIKSFISYFQISLLHNHRNSHRSQTIPNNKF